MKFTIPENWHYSVPAFILPHYNVTEALFEDVKFDKNCWYEKSEVEFTGVNKLCGLGYGFNHHKNSIRVGWQPEFENKDVIKLYAYWYDQSVDGYQKEFICDVTTNMKFNIGIDIFDDYYTVNIGENSVNVKKTHNIKWGFWLKPYFGGKSKSPVKMKIWLKHS